MPLRGPVLAAVDLSDAADATLRQGHAIASDLRAPLVVCHVLPESFSVRVLFPQEAGVDATAQAELEGKARAIIRAKIATVLGPATAAIEIAIESGTPHAGILAIADRLGAGLILVAPGATAPRVARSAHCPVLVARPSPAQGSVLGATDFSDPSTPALRLAADEARRRTVGLRVLHCLDLDRAASPAIAGLPGVMPMPPLQASVVERLESAARARLVEALAGTGEPGAALLLRSPPAAGIVEAARTEATALIVIGTRGRTGLARFALGSVAEDVMSQAPCSVLVVPLSHDA